MDGKFPFLVVAILPYSQMKSNINQISKYTQNSTTVL